MPDNLTLTGVEPTVFFVRAGEALRQLVRLTVSGAAAGDRLWLRLRGRDTDERLDLAPDSGGTVDAYFPDLRRPADLTLELGRGDEVVDSRTISWQPRRHWQLHVVHNSHHDLGYTDLPSNLLREHDGFMDDIIRFCRETDGFPEDSRFRYLVEQAWSVLHYVENRPPEVVAELVRLMREGRIELTALFGNQTSELSSHEEQVRLLYPAFRLKRRFGVPIESAELNDVPGLSWGLVSVLAGAGIRYFAPRIPDYFRWGFTVHPFWDEQAVLPRDMPGAFWWQGPDGQRVLFWYGDRVSLWSYDQALRDVPEHLCRLEERGYAWDVLDMRFQGGGRDNAPPDVRLSLIARQWNEQWAYPRLIVSTNSRFFRAFESAAGDGLPVLRGDLPNTDYTVGAASTARETAINRGAHETIAAGERFAAVAATVGDYDYPADTLAEAYDQAMLYDEHTWGMSQCYGVAQEACFSQKGQTAYRAAALGHDVLSKATNRLADGVRLDGEGYHVIAYNPLAWRRTEVARALFHQQEPCGHPMYWRAPADPSQPAVMASGTAIGRGVLHLPADLAEQPFRLVDIESGAEVPHQVMALGHFTRPAPFASYRAGLTPVDPAHRYELLFLARDVPPCGYRAYRIESVAGGNANHGGLTVEGNVLENRYYRVRLDPGTGAITSIHDKETGRELVDAEAPHGFNSLVVRAADTAEVFPYGVESVSVGARGPLYASLIVQGRGEGAPRLTQEIVLYRDTKRIDVFNRILWEGAPLREVYFAFPFAVPEPRFAFEAPNSVVHPIEDQLPGSNTDAYCAQHWVSAWNDEGGVTWSSPDAPVAVLGQLWPGYVSQAHHGATPPGYGHEFLGDPAEFRHGHIYSYALASNFRTNFSPVQVGDCLFRYSFTSHPGDWRDGGAARFGWAAANPLTVQYVRGPQEGRLPPTTSFANVDQGNVLLLALKAAEDGDGLVARLYESEGRPTTVRLELPFYDIDQAFLTNLAEENLAVVSHDRHAVIVQLDGFGLATVRCRGRAYPCPRRFAYY